MSGKRSRSGLQLFIMTLKSFLRTDSEVSFVIARIKLYRTTEYMIQGEQNNL